MMCFAWNSRTACYDSGMKATEPAGEGPSCPNVNWWWLLAAGAGFLALTGRNKRS